MESFFEIFTTVWFFLKSSSNALLERMQCDDYNFLPTTAVHSDEILLTAAVYSNLIDFSFKKKKNNQESVSDKSYQEQK